MPLEELAHHYEALMEPVQRKGMSYDLYDI